MKRQVECGVGQRSRVRNLVDHRGELSCNPGDNPQVEASACADVQRRRLATFGSGLAILSKRSSARPQPIPMAPIFESFMYRASTRVGQKRPENPVAKMVHYSFPNEPLVAAGCSSSFFSTVIFPPSCGRVSSLTRDGNYYAPY